MIKRMIMLFATALLVVAMAVPAFAASPSERECMAAGGTFDLWTWPTSGYFLRTADNGVISSNPY